MNGATGATSEWSVRASDDVSYLSARLAGGEAEGKIATWARVKLAPAASGLLWGVNRIARTYSIAGADIDPARVAEFAQTDHPAAIRSRRCARQGHG